MMHVMDACSLIAYLRGEEGSEVVDSLLLNRNNLCLAHGINLAEVFYNFMKVASERVALDAIGELESTGLITRDDMDPSFWQLAGRYKAENKASLAECFALALASRVGAEIVTSAHHEFNSIAEKGICPVKFIR